MTNGTLGYEGPTTEDRLDALEARIAALESERAGGGSRPEFLKVRKCVNCGGPLPAEARKDRLTCKAACRLEWWRKSQREEEVKA